MSKKTFLIFIIFIVLIAGGVAWYLFLGEKTADLLVGNNSSDEGLFPFGDNKNTTTTQSQTKNTAQTDSGTTNTSPTRVPNPTQKNSRLRQISDVPTAGVVVFNVASSTFIWYVERSTGHIYEVASNSSTVKKLSNVTLPKIYDALWTEDGSKVIFRYLKGDNDTIKTFSAKLSTTSSPEDAIAGTFLSDNIKNISILGSKIYYQNESSEGSVGISANLDGTGKVSVFTSSFADWISAWTSTTGVTLYSRPSGFISGVAYLLNPVNGSYVKVADNLNGLEALGNTDGGYVLISSMEEGGISTSVVDMKKASVEPLGISTLIDKCVWSKKEKNIVYCAVPTLPTNQTYPDAWYKGKVSFNDNLWRIDVLSGETKEITNGLSNSNTPLDVIKMDLDQNEANLVFINKKDQTVWSYSLSN